MRLGRRIGFALLVCGLLVGPIAVPSLACHSATHTAHCYGSGVYSSSRYGVHSDEPVRNNSINSGFSAAFIFVYIDGNNWMSGGYIKGTSVVGSSTVPKGYSDWTSGGVYGKSGFVCTPTVGSSQHTIVNRQSSTNVWHAHVCNISLTNNKNLGAATGVGYAQTEITDSRNGCRGHYDVLDYEAGVNDGWYLWPSLGTFRGPDDSTNPITVQKIANYELHTCGG